MVETFQVTVTVTNSTGMANVVEAFNNFVPWANYARQAASRSSRGDVVSPPVGSQVNAILATEGISRVAVQKIELDRRARD